MSEENKAVETPVVEAKKSPKKKKVDVNAFISRKLKDINELTDEAKKRYLAEKVRANRKEN